ncbi:MAG: hypothetical protein LBS40_06290, partial [Burkholderiales bacterium]|nr:hypothetical protein [Burkholderiales bacterium]
ENETTQQYQIDPQSNRLLKVEGTSNLVTYQYDETGSLTRRNADTFIYDQRGRLVQANGTTYKIDALNLRVEKQGQGAATSSGIRQFVYDEQGHLIGEYDAATGNPIIEHVWLNDLPVAVIKNSSVFYVYPDHLGTPRAITDDQNRTVWYWNYDEPFGKTEPNEDPNGLGDFTYNLRFPGQYYDAETRLHYNWHRDYDASTGRYIQSDPIGLEGGINIYAYVEGNPIMFTDPWGLFTITVDDSGGRNGSTYGGTMTVVGNNGQTVTVPVSTWPNPTNPSPGIQPGAYPGTYSPTGHRGRTNGVRVNDGNAIPTLGPNPAQNNQPFADGINIHCGDTQTNRGSSGCITIDPNYCQQVWNALQPGETGPVQVNRP